MDEFQSVKDNLQASLVSTIKSVNRVAAQDLSFQRTVNPEVDERLNRNTDRVLSLANRLLKAAPRPGRDSAPQLEEAEDIDLNWRRIVDVVDATFEKADVALDEYTGLVKRKDPPAGEAENPPQKKTKSASALQPGQRNANITKPQLSFEVPPNNFPTTPWKPILAEKPHAIVPLEEGLQASKKANDASLQYERPTIPHQPQHNLAQKAQPVAKRKLARFMNNDANLWSSRYNHPYETEIQRMEYPERVYQQAEPIMYSPITETKATWVDTYEGVLDMLAELREAGEIAIDLEHHDYRTYVGLTCLMQISTRSKDWIVDTLKPWRHRLQVLNEVFADPRIVKVLHGAYMDVIWLQRDLGLYLNGYVDTHFASEALGYSQRSLAFLLKKFVDFDADKKYQLADWRIRPLPEEMFFYARSDTHFLLYIYDMVRNELLQKSDRSSPETDLIGRVLRKSREQALSRYEHPSCDAETGAGSRGWYSTILKQPQALTGEQFAVFRAVWKWRDELARRADESPVFVLPQQGVWDVARVLPPDLKALHSLLPRHAWQARSEIKDLWKVVQEARVEGQSGPTLQQFLTNGGKLASGRKEIEQSAGLKLEEADVPRLAKSHLFGGSAMSSVWEGQQAKRANDYVQLPWQRLYAEKGIELAVRGPAAEEARPAEAVAESQKAEPEEDTEFTLKAGRKRKRAAAQGGEVEEAANAEEADVAEVEKADEAEDRGMAIESSSEGVGETTSGEATSGQTSGEDKRAEPTDAEREAAIQKKREKKERKKEAKRLAKAASGEGEEEPFDYSKAETVLHGKKKAVDAEAKTKKFDPFVKGEGIKGARKAPPIRGTRSATFRK